MSLIDHSSAASRLIASLEAERGLIVVLTGAGISLASGVPTFRGSDPGAVWSRDITELATLQYFSADPVGSWRWYRQRFTGLLAARPNAAHHAVTDVERWQVERGGGFLLVTQNIDTLHEQAGSRRMVKVHGSAGRCRCSDEWCRLGRLESLPLDDVSFDAFDRDPREEAIPRCPLCGSLLRPHVLWFDELYTSHAEYAWHTVEASVSRMRLLLCVGTSLAVGVTRFLQSPAVGARAPLFLIDPGERPAEAARPLIHIRERAEDLLPAIVEALRHSGE